MTLHVRFRRAKKRYLALKKLINCVMKYLIKGKGEAVVLLHGWGANKEAMQPLTEALSGEYIVIAPDLYGFGASPTDRVMTLDDYVVGIQTLLMKENVSGATLIGHSFGGRIAVRLAARRPDMVKKLVLIDAAGLKPRFDPRRTIKRAVNAFGKATGWFRPRGSADYENATGYMRGTFLNVIHDHQNGECPLICCPTLIIWGAEDRDTPPYMARKFNRLIPRSSLRILPGAGHFSYLDAPSQTAFLIKEFLGNDCKRD